MNEKAIEKRLCQAVAKLGGKALKFTSPYNVGMPDRIVLMPGGCLHFVEMKTTGKRPTPIQRECMRQLELLGFEVWVVDSQEGLDCFTNKLKNHVDRE